MMMSIASQRARGRGHRAFYLHPEAQVGSGAGPDGASTQGGELRRTTIPDSTTTTTVSGATPDPETESTTTSTTTTTD